MSDFDGSDLTDLDDDESYTQGNSAQAKQKKTKQAADNYRIRGALKAPRTTTFSTQALHEQMVANDIDLEADYQRDVVWPINKQIGLIDSLFRNFYVPPVIFAVTELPDGGQKRVCIDGKQRLTSIWRFMDGLIPYKDENTNQKFWYKDLPNRTEKGSLMPERYTKIFRNKQIACIEYSDLTDNNEREIFQRVQLGMALTPAEKLQAVHSTTSTFIRDLLREYVTDRLADHLTWDVGRANDFRGLSTAVYLLEKGICSLPSIPGLTKWLQETEEYDDEFMDDVHQTFKIFVWMAEDKECSKCFNFKRDDQQLKVSPAEFISIVLLIHKHKAKLTLRQLSEAIRKMRLDVRKLEKDIRLNSRCMKHLQSFIKDVRPSDLKADPGHGTAAVAIKKLFIGKPKAEESEPEIDTKATKVGQGKRKREDEDDDAEYIPKKPPVASQRTPISRPATNTAIKSSSAAEPVLAFSTPRSPVPQPVYPSQTQPIQHPPEPIRTAPPVTTHAPSPHPPTAPRMHPDRLAALHAAKSGVPVPDYVPPSAPRENSFTMTNGVSHSSQYPATPSPYPPRWVDQPVMRLGPVIGGADVTLPPSSISHDPRISPSGVFVEGQTGLRPPHPLPPPPYSVSRPVSHGRDDYSDRSYGRRYSGSRY